MAALGGLGRETRHGPATRPPRSGRGAMDWDRPKAPFHAGRRRCGHSTTSVEAELWITDQYFGAAKKRDSAIDARG
jgi:hypothetical protein